MRAPAKLLAAFLPKAEESKLGRILVETVILLSMHNQTDAAKSSPRCRPGLQGGRGRHLRDSQAGVRGEGEGENRQKNLTQAANQAAGEGDEKRSSSLILNPIETLGRSLQRQAPPLLCARPSSRPLSWLLRYGRSGIMSPPDGQKTEGGLVWNGTASLLMPPSPIHFFGILRYSDRDDAPDRSSSVPSVASERIPGAKPGP